MVKMFIKCPLITTIREIDIQMTSLSGGISGREQGNLTQKTNKRLFQEPLLKIKVHVTEFYLPFVQI